VRSEEKRGRWDVVRMGIRKKEERGSWEAKAGERRSCYLEETGSYTINFVAKRYSLLLLDTHP
jgi:hypothetical protein